MKKCYACEKKFKPHHGLSKYCSKCFGNPIVECWRRKAREAASRGVKFYLTYKEWLSVWKKSGHPRNINFVMARFGDKGPYAIGNVKIITRGENVSEAQVGKSKSGLMSKRLSDKIKQEYKYYSRTHGTKALAKKYKIKWSMVADIVSERTWR